MPYDIYGNHLRPGYCEVHPDVRHEYPCPCCHDDYRDAQVMQAEQDTGPSDEELCGYYGHPEYGDVGRCLCGERSYPAAGAGAKEVGDE